ncbi:hypothetical protein EP7_005192 [Isosphaeraceae bacterium EP7]
MHELILLTAMSATGGLFGGHKAKCPPAPVAVAAPVACVPAPKKAGCFGGMKLGLPKMKLGHSGKKSETVYAGAPVFEAVPLTAASPQYATSQAAPIVSGTAAAPAPAAPATSSIPPAPVIPGVTDTPAAPAPATPDTPAPATPDTPAAPAPPAPTATEVPAAPAPAVPATPEASIPAVPAVPGVEPK